MNFFEGQCYRAGYRNIAGIDEAGRGPLAGPVVAAAVIFSREWVDEEITDSKRLAPKRREELFGKILSSSRSVGIGVVDQNEIDRTNILQATLKAMEMAVVELSPPPDYLLVDGIHGLPVQIPQRLIRRGDTLSISIAAASIVAKVTRDRMMMEHHERYPQYNFAKHKGYGTREHLEAIRKFGYCELHRMTFRGVKAHSGPT
ncbi:MAG: ribonuclease HII [Syntrophobacterales bacterium]|nr:MAG: ribonuclease HII [Syntrophobacterales bacterium]